ncbi:MAG: S-layer homology domain-containing protein [Ruminococcaceae bacterium]|nr:S-layer homology domain-containing protein [Oscillospiraceae bacterium]
MRITKLLVTLILTLALLLPMTAVHAAQFGKYQIFPNDPVEAGYVEPELDGEITKGEGWNDSISVYVEPIDPIDPAIRSEKTTAVNFANTAHDVGLNADVYFGYDESYFYFSASIDKFGIEDEYLYATSDLSSEDGFTGDVFTLSVDPLSLLSADSDNYTKLAPRYYVTYDSEGNGAVYHDASSENIFKSGRDRMFSEFDLAAGRISEEYANIAVKADGNGDWRFEAAVSWDIIIEDMYANSGTELTEELYEETYFELLLSNKDWKSMVTYRFCGFDIESGEYYTSAIFSTVDDSSLSGVPGQYTDGMSIETFGLTFYVCHEHDALISGFESEEDLATFEKDGKLTYICGICGQVVKTETLAKVPFTDVKAGQWYEDALLRCYNFSYFKGTSATTFAPNMTMTRAMFVQVLANWMGVDTSEYTCDFSDVKSGDWFYGAVAWAASEGITKGTSATKFSPNDPITREQAATFFMNFTKTIECYEEPAITEFDGYVDADEVSSWAKDGMLWAVENGIIKSTSSDELKLSPKTKANRITAAQMLCNYEDWFEAYLESLFEDIIVE